MKRVLPFLFLAIAALSSCNKEVSKNIDQSRIWTSYQMFYNQNVDKTFVTAVFRFSSASGSVLQLSDPSLVLFNGEPLTWNEQTGFYEKEVSGILLTGTFEWTDTEGKMYTNTATIHEVAYETLPDTIYKDDGTNQFTWDGDVVAQDERMVLAIAETEADNRRVFFVDTIDAFVIKLDSTKLTQIASGSVILYFDRIYSPDLQEATDRGGKREGRYRPTDRTVFLADSIQ